MHSIKSQDSLVGQILLSFLVQIIFLWYSFPFVFLTTTCLKYYWKIISQRSYLLSSISSSIYSDNNYIVLYISSEVLTTYLIIFWKMCKIEFFFLTHLVFLQLKNNTKIYGKITSSPSRICGRIRKDRICENVILHFNPGVV